MRWVLWFVWLVMGIPSALAMDSEAFVDQMVEMQRDYGNVVVVVRGRDASQLHHILAERPAHGVSFRFVRPSAAGKTVEGAGSRCGLLATPIPTGWRTTLLGPCVVSTPPPLSQAYALGKLVVRGTRVVSAAGELTAMEVALRFSDTQTLVGLERRLRRTHRAAAAALVSGLLLGRVVGPVLLVGALFAAPIVALTGGDMAAVGAAAATGAALVVVGIGLTIAGGIVMARGGQGRGKVHRYYTPAELQAGVAAHNDSLAEQLGYQRGARVSPGAGLEWALWMTPVGPRLTGRF